MLRFTSNKCSARSQKGLQISSPQTWGKHGTIKLLSEQKGTQYNEESNECDTKESANICFYKGKYGPVKLEGFEGLSNLVDKAGLASTVCLDLKNLTRFSQSLNKAEIKALEKKKGR